MSYDETLAQRVRRLLPQGRQERRMFGGVSFMVDNHLCCSVTGEGLLVRVTPETREELLSHPGVQPMVMGRRTMAGYLRVCREALEGERELSMWIRRSLELCASLQVKAGRAAKRSER